MTKKILLWIFVFVLLVLGVSSYQISTLYNGNTAGNYSVTVDYGNVTGYLYLKMFTNITNATLNITALNYYSFDIPTYDARYIIYPFDSNNYNDGNWNTYSYAAAPDINPATQYDMGLVIWNYSWVSDYNYTNTYFDVKDGGGRTIVNVSQACSDYARTVGNLSFMVKSYQKISVAKYYIEWNCKKQAGADLDMANWDNMRNFTGSRAVFNHLLSYQNGSSISNPELEIGEVDGTPEFSFVGLYSGTTQTDFTNIANSIIDNNCNCTNCTISGADCILPFTLHSTTPATLQIDTISIKYNYTFVINIRNQTNNNLLTGITTSLGLISDTYSKNYTTTTGIIEDIIVPQNYTIRYSAPNYYQRTAYKDLSEGQNTTFNLYLLYNTGTSAANVTATVYDDYGDTIDGVRIDYYKYDITTNSYIFMGTGTTNFEGEATLYLTLNNEYYKFYLYYPPTNLVRITNPTYVTDTNLVFQISTEEDATQNYFDINKIGYTFTYNNSQFKFIYNDAQGIGDEFCLYAYRSTIYDSTQLNYSCSTLSSDTLTANVNIINGSTYVGKAYVKIGSKTYIIDTKSFTAELGNPLKNNPLGLFIVFIIIILFVFIMRSLILALILLPIPIMMGSLMGIIAIPLIYGIILEVIMVSIAIIIKN